MPIPLTHDDPVALGPYRLIARLGSGGMGTVYVARSGGGRTVALKTMHAAIAADPAARTRFRLEVDAARVIGDRFGARVMDADPLAETPWMATEYVLGPSLDEAVGIAGPLPEASVRALGAALCGALGQLHRSDVVHRDLKPSNILIAGYGPKLIDFGIARAIGDDRLTRAGAAVGTPAFMSPEQATGQDHEAAGDVFALAGVLVFAATGRAPFGHGQTADLLYRVRYAEADLEGVPASLAQVLAPCLSKDPRERPGTEDLAVRLHDGTGEFADHLPDVLLADIGRRAADVWQPMPQRAAPPAVPDTYDAASEEARRAPSRRRFLRWGGAVAASGAVATGAVWWGTRDRRQRVTAHAPTRNLDPLWQYEGSGRMVIEKWGLVIPQSASGHVDLATGGKTVRINSYTGRLQKTITVSAAWWQLVSVGNTDYRLSDDFDHLQGQRVPVEIATYDTQQQYIKPTGTYFADTDYKLRGHQLLNVTGTTAYVVLGQGPLNSERTFLASQTWTLRAADLTTGRTLWKQPLPKRPDQSTRLHILSAAVVGTRLVTFQEADDKKVRLVVRDTRTGAVLWDEPHDAPDPEPLRSPIAVDQERVYVGGTGLRAFRLSDGAQAWASGQGRRYSPPTVKEGVVYAVAEESGIEAVDAVRGTSLWTEKTDQAQGVYTAWRPLVGEQRAYYRNGVHLRAVGLSSHTTERTYKTSGEQFHVDAHLGLILAVDADHLTAYRLV
ncbi:protein kinase [Streptomyces sp. JHA26]|uniref:serine/threonine-protein kinase n=1 Tax=Streptomyces sp. JHA26 TaxID=1917143 RepID=UPI00098B6D41|nr:protein kinase [Streptomyces sp. JHA26]